MSSYSITLPYSTYLGLYDGLNLYLVTLDSLATASKKAPPTKADFATMPSGMSPEGYERSMKLLDKRSSAYGPLMERMKLALGAAGIFPPGHPLETKHDALITLKLADTDLREINALVCGATMGLRTMLTPLPGVDPNGMSMMLMNLMAQSPLDMLVEHTPHWLRAVLDAKAPIF